MKLILAAAPLALLCTASAQNDPDAPLPGLWEVTSTMIDVSGPGMTPERRADILKSRPPRVEHICFARVVPHVGDVKADGSCTVSRVSDSGKKVDREWRCPAKGANPEIHVTITGERSPQRYTHTTSWTGMDDGKPGMTLVWREEARRAGDCNPKS